MNPVASPRWIILTLLAVAAFGPLEALSQVSGLLFAQRLEHTGKLALLLSMDGVKFRKTVVPGDQLILCSETVRLRRRTAHCKCTAWVGDMVAAEAEIKFMLVDAEPV